MLIVDEQSRNQVVQVHYMCVLTENERQATEPNINRCLSTRPGPSVAAKSTPRILSGR